MNIQQQELDIHKYLERINFKGELSLNIECLRNLHRCHIMSIPFEAMDVHLKKSISLELSRIYTKVILNDRGGFCYELNYLFYSLLAELGYNCAIISSRIFNKGSYGPEFDHMSIVVKSDDDWLVDVGYGNLFIEPLKIRTNEIQEDKFKSYKIDKLDDHEFLLLESTKESNDYIKKYTFNIKPREIEEFSEQCIYKQSSPDSYFVKNIICTIPTKDGRKTILNDSFKVKRYDHMEERKIRDDSDLQNILRDEFRIYF